MVGRSSGEVDVEPPLEAQDIHLTTANAKFLHDVGGLYLQVLDQEPKSQAITAADYKQLGRLITEIGKRTADLGIKLGYRNNLHSVSGRARGLERCVGLQYQT